MQMKTNKKTLSKIKNEKNKKRKSNYNKKELFKFDTKIQQNSYIIYKYMCTYIKSIINIFNILYKQIYIIVYYFILFYIKFQIFIDWYIIIIIINIIYIIIITIIITLYINY